MPILFLSGNRIGDLYPVWSLGNITPKYNIIAYEKLRLALRILSSDVTTRIR
jgi:hypothetical protein